jgi:thioredoxin 1
MEINVSKENFEKEVLKSEIPVLVDFWASWCMPCLALGPVVTHMAKNFDGKLKVCKLNVDESPEIAQKYFIQSIPTMIVFKAGVETDRMIGLLSKKHIEDSLRTQIAC